MEDEMHCSKCGKASAVYLVNGKAFCETCWRKEPQSGVVVAVTASSHSTAPGTFMPVEARAYVDQALFANWQRRQEQGAALLTGTATMMTCAHCLQQRPAEHTATVSFGKMLPAAYCVCGSCLDALAEALYLGCAKRGVPHWRKKENRDA